MQLYEEEHLEEHLNGVYRNLHINILIPDKKGINLSVKNRKNHFHSIKDRKFYSTSTKRTLGGDLPIVKLKATVNLNDKSTRDKLLSKSPLSKESSLAIVPYNQKRTFMLCRVLKRKEVLSPSLTNRKVRYSNIYDELEFFLLKNPINMDTQKKLEKFLLDYSYINFNKDNVVSGINISYFNKKLLEFLLPYQASLKVKIKKLLDRNTVDSDLSVKNGLNKYLIELFKNIDHDYVISVIFGRFLRIVTNHKLNLTDNNSALEILYDIGNDLVNQYFHCLYDSVKKVKIDKYTLRD
jgi:hypothetical protein